MSLLTAALPDAPTLVQKKPFRAERVVRQRSTDRIRIHLRITRNEPNATVQKDKVDAQANRDLPLESETSKRLVDERVIPIAEESLRTHVRPVESGEVRVHTSIEETIESVEADLTSTTVAVRRVPVGRVVDGPLPVRTEGDTTIIPVVEERLVVRTEWVLVEEVFVERTRRTVPERREVRLRKTSVDIERRSRPDEEF